MRVSQYPWGRCSKAVHGQCKLPCKKTLAHHIVPGSYDWCICEPVERPPMCKTWAAYNRALTLQLAAEDKMSLRHRYCRRDGKFVTEQYIGLPSYPRSQ